MTKRLLLVPVVFLFFSACSSVPPVCKPEGAREAGISQAMRGEDYNESQGGVCEEEHRNVFKTNFQAGYQEGKARYCTPATVESTGQGHGQEGRAPEFSEGRYHICETKTGLKASYFRGYQHGLDEFCGESKARAAGMSVGEAGRAPEFDEGRHAVCGPKLKKVAAAYLSGHREGLAKYCTGGNADSQGMEDGSKGAEVNDISGKYQICGAGTAKKIAKVYVDAYARGFARYCSPENISGKAREQAQKTGQGTFPAEYQKCLAKYPELGVQYVAVFREARRQVVESQCTYQKGLANGQQDGERTNDKATGMPEFCDAQLFSVYLSGYMEGWKQTKDRVCNATEAYKQGVSTGMSGGALSFSPPGNCPSEYQQALHQKFTEGYYYGASQRPQMAQVGGYPSGTQTYCRSNSDCRAGQYCRNRGDGVTVCMGQGTSGFYCVSSGDCGGGMYCRSLPQNPGLRVCTQ